MKGRTHERLRTGLVHAFARRVATARAAGPAVVGQLRPRSPVPPLRVWSRSPGRRTDYIGLIVFDVGYFRLSLGFTRGGLPSASSVTPIWVGGLMMLAGLGWTIYNRWLLAGRTASRSDDD